MMESHPKIILCFSIVLTLFAYQKGFTQEKHTTNQEGFQMGVKAIS